MSTYLALALIAALVGAVLALLERNHRRTDGLPPRPCGGVPDRDNDLRRVLAELDVSSLRGRA